MHDKWVCIHMGAVEIHMERKKSMTSTFNVRENSPIKFDN